jgi:hypothetical protein
VYAPTSLIGWRPLSGRIVPGVAVRAGMPSRLVVARGAGQQPDVGGRGARRPHRRHPGPAGLPLSTRWLLNDTLLTDQERAVLNAREQVNDDIAHQHIAHQHITQHHRGGGAVAVAEYGPRQ